MLAISIKSVVSNQCIGQTLYLHRICSPNIHRISALKLLSYHLFYNLSLAPSNIPFYILLCVPCCFVFCNIYIEHVGNPLRFTCDTHVRAWWMCWGETCSTMHLDAFAHTPRTLTYLGLDLFLYWPSWVHKTELK